MTRWRKRLEKWYCYRWNVFAEPGGSEGDHTARFYQGVKERGEISVRKVLNQLLGGGNSKIFVEIFTPRNDPI